ncbi:GAF domain-containing protein [Streptomyces sp. NPDC006733]|uniref:GAF domain-containing protein n=1 Tax=Streptomyces sp. NPDC006733 TaxID=3155460 RepID=UPI00340E0CF6
MNRQQQIVEAFVSLADTFDRTVDPLVLVDRLISHCVNLAGADAASVTLVTARGALRTLSVSDDRADLAEVFQLQTVEGPCHDCWQSWEPVDAADLPAFRERWPRFVPSALAAGFHSAYALPVRVHGQNVGTLNLLLAPPRAAREDLHLAQAFAEVAGIAIMQWRADPARPEDILTHTQAVISAKASLETAKGMLAAAGGLSAAEAAALLREYSRLTGRRPTETAQDLIRRTLDPEAVLAAAERP